MADGPPPPALIEAPLHPIEVKLRELSSGPRVDNEPVWQFLDRCEQMEEMARREHQSDSSKQPGQPTGLGLDRGRAVKHLGSFVYDPTGPPSLSPEMLVQNVGATVEMRISGRTIGLGITEEEWQQDEARLQKEVLERMDKEARDGATPSLGLTPTPASISPPDTFRGRWRLGWRGLEHARINREIRLSQVWHEQRQQAHRDKRLRRSLLPEFRTQAAVPAQPVSDAQLEQAAWDFWAQPSLEQRKLWGTDVYTDDSDVLAMCVHAGWIEAPTIPGVPEWLSGGGSRRVAQAWTALAERQAQATGEPLPRPPAADPVSLVPHSTCDLSVILRIAPKLILYKGCHRGGVQSRSWGNTHDGVSLVVESVELRAPNYAAGTGRRSMKARLRHMAQLRTLAAMAPIPRSLNGNEDVRVSDKNAPGAMPALALPQLATPGTRSFWDARPVSKGQVL